MTFLMMPSNLKLMVPKVVVLVIALDAECPDSEYSLVPKVPGYNRYSKCQKQDR